MNISTNWLKDFIDLPESIEELADNLTFGGLEVEGIVNYESQPGGLEGIVIGEIKTCEKHPNADRLSITTVDIGNGEVKPIVCGAPNVAAGQKVLAATVGSTIHPKGSESFKIKKAKIRGEVSEGMICAEDELGLGDSHDGIMVLETELPNGTPASELFTNYRDKVLEIGLTPNRGDATGHLGVARDIKALYGKKLKSFIPEKWPEKGDSLPIDVELKNPEACPRYSGIVISGLKVGESPEWLQNKLKSIGSNPINNVVDVTNYILHDLGQPLHAFDYDKIAGSKVLVKSGFNKKKFKTLDEEDRELHEEDLMICDEKHPMCIGGVFGGVDSGVTASTTRIFLESACFDPVFIRKTSQRHGLKTDAAFRFERGTDIDITIDALKKASALLAEVAGGKISSEVIDIYPEKKKENEIELRKSDILRLIGIEIDSSTVIDILQSLDIEKISDNDTSWTFKIPNYRTEVTRPADLLEEILRIYGFNNVPVEKDSGTSYLAPFDENDPAQLEEIISEYLVGRNCNEIQTNSLASENHSKIEENFDHKSTPAGILNKLSEELGLMRDNLLSSGLDVLRHNINRKQQNLRLFEFGFVYADTGSSFLEKRQLSIFLSGNANEDSWMLKDKKQDFFDLKSLLNGIFQRLGLVDAEIEEGKSKMLKTGGFNIISNGKFCGRMGEVENSLLQKFEVGQAVQYVQLEMDVISELRGKTILFKEIPKFPEVRRDLSLVLDKKIRYEEIRDLALKNGQGLIDSIRVFDVFEGKPLEKHQKSYALSFILLDRSKTLDDSRIDGLMNRLISKYEKDLGAIIRR
jgi:phenylalanyl-tRNA synthetase beta chain